MKSRIVGLVHFPHAARAERLENLVGAQPSSMRQIHALTSWSEPSRRKSKGQSIRPEAQRDNLRKPSVNVDSRLHAS